MMCDVFDILINYNQKNSMNHTYEFNPKIMPNLSVLRRFCKEKRGCLKTQKRKNRVKGSDSSFLC